MLISPHEQERLLIHVAAGLARERRARGLRLNYPEAVALITSFLLEGARDSRPVVALMAAGRTGLTRAQAMDGGPATLTESLRSGGAPGMTAGGQGRARVPVGHQARRSSRADPVIPGEILPGEGPV